MSVVFSLFRVIGYLLLAGVALFVVLLVGALRLLADADPMPDPSFGDWFDNDTDPDGVS